MGMKEVYRVEHVLSNEGVYTSQFRTPKMRGVLNEFYNGGFHCPPPWEDAALCEHWRGLPDQSMWKFGFSTMGQFNRWFCDSDHLAVFKECGFVLKVYEVPRSDDSLRYGANQCIFFEGHERFVRAHDLVTLEEVELISDIKIKEKELCDEIAY